MSEAEIRLVDNDEAARKRDAAVAETVAIDAAFEKATAPCAADYQRRFDC